MKKANLIIFNLLILVFSIQFVYAQKTRIDSLINEIRTSANDTVRIKCMNDLGWKLMYINQDTAVIIGRSSLTSAIKSGYIKFIGKSLSNLGVYFWMSGQLDSAIHYLNQSLEIYKKINHENGISSALGNLAAIYSDKGQYYYSLDIYKEALKLAEKTNNSKSQGAIYGNMAATHIKIGSYSYAYDLYNKAIALSEKVNDQHSLALWTGAIGNLSYFNKNYDKALDYYFKALKLHERENNKLDYSREIGNIGLTYWSMGNNEMALSYFREALKLRRDLSDSKGLSSVYMYIGNVYFNKNQFDSALFYYENSYSISSKGGFNDHVSSAIRNIGSVYVKKNIYDKAEQYLIQSMNMDKKSGDLNNLKHNYSALTELYAQTKKWQKAYEYYKLFNIVNDSLFSAEKSKELGRKEAASEYERMHAVKEAEHKKELEKQEAVAKLEKQRQTTWLILVICVALGISIIAIIIFSSLKLAKKQKQIIQLQKNEVEQKNKEILDSITYAKRLQDAILVSETELTNTFNDAFVLYKPKDIIAGDFYWTHKLNHKSILIAAADCTGHGVPGALVSIVCSNALSRSVIEFNKKSTGEILDKTRELILEAFTKNDSDVKDGMDISLLKLDLESGEAEWSGANNSLVYFSSGKFCEIKADKQPVGLYFNSKSFSTHSIRLEKGDELFLFTDGYADQFGGPNGKKLKYKNLFGYFENVKQLPCKQQKEELNNMFAVWKGNLEQLDDICIIGIKV